MGWGILRRWVAAQIIGDFSVQTHAFKSRRRQDTHTLPIIHSAISNTLLEKLSDPSNSYPLAYPVRLSPGSQAQLRSDRPQRSAADGTVNALA